MTTTQTADGHRTLTHRGGAVSLDPSQGQIDLENLRDEIEQTGGYVLYYGTLAAEAAADARRQHLSANIIRAERAQSFRGKAAKLAERVTERHIEEQTLVDPTVQAADLQAIEADERAAIMRAMYEGVAQKQRTLTNLAGQLQREVAARRAP